MNDLEAEESTDEACALADKIRPFFAGVNSEVVAAALGEMVATYIGGHHPRVRASARDLLIEFVDRLVPAIIEDMIEEGRVPPEWRGKTVQ